MNYIELVRRIGQLRSMLEGNLSGDDYYHDRDKLQQELDNLESRQHFLLHETNKALTEITL